MCARAKTLLIFPRVVQRDARLGIKPRPPTLKELKNYILTISLGLIIAFFIWYASYLGWFVFSNPATPFTVETSERNNAVTWEKLKTDYPNMYRSDLISTQVHFNLSVQYWDKILYPKDSFTFHVTIKNSPSNALWYQSILVFIVDSADYVRGKHLVQLWSEDDGIPEDMSKEYIMYFNVPDDMKAQNFYVTALLYGKLDSSYPYITESTKLAMRDDQIYGKIPDDNDHEWFLSETTKMFHTYPSLIPYVFQVGSIATNTAFIIALALMIWASEKIKRALGTQYGFYFVVIIFIIIFFLIVFLLASLLF